MTPGHAVALALDATHERQVAQLEALAQRRRGIDERAEHEVGAAPAHGSVRLRIAGDRQGADAVAFRKLVGELLVQQGADGRAHRGIRERGILHVQEALRLVDELVPLGVVDERDLLAEAGRRGRACPVRALAADVGRAGRGRERRRMRRALAAEVEQVRALSRGEHPLHDRRGRDAERLAVIPGLRALRHLARAGLRVGVLDVAHALAGPLGDLRAGFEHDHAGIGESLQQRAGVRRADRAGADDRDGGVV